MNTGKMERRTERQERGQRDCARRLTVRGLVQGVGFRPFVYRLARREGVRGDVSNSLEGVRIRAYFRDEKHLDRFVELLRSEAPPAARIWEVKVEPLPPEERTAKGPEGFSILPSDARTPGITQVSPDIAVCEACLRDMKEQPHRRDYPFVNCTLCGPRFTIITDLPYDRSHTTMAPFEMCDRCRAEYEDVNDRRFHAQPVACNDCGPHYRTEGAKEVITDLRVILRGVARELLMGGRVAIKGMGGYFLACDATCEAAVQQLRASKVREDKPFAVMFRDLDTLRQYAEVSPEEEEELFSWRRPVVIVEASGENRLAPSVSMGFPTIGALLPYMPFHYLLFEELPLPALVFTSGNLSGEPIVIDDEEARRRLGPVTDMVVSYNRRIHNRVDDSVVFFERGVRRVVRRSRGFAPAPVPMPFRVDGIFAGGAELVNCFCLGKEDQAIMSQHIGDLKNYDTYAFYREAAVRLMRLFRVEPQLGVCDLHPDYLSTRFVKEQGWPVTEVQHHHAHLAAVMAEHGITGKVVGAVFDGTGLGDDGRIWGGEFLVGDLTGYHRAAHLRYMPMPGGDKAALQPWRMALASLYETFGLETVHLDLPIVRRAEKEGTLYPILEMIRKGINTPLTSSAGRLFDAVAALTGVCTESTFHAEAPMRLEAAADPGIRKSYPWEWKDDEISLVPAFEAMVRELKKGRSPASIAGKFHRTMAEMIIQTLLELADTYGVGRVVLAGGTFQNRILLRLVENRLEKKGLQVLVPREFPVNDGSIALGQLAVAGKRRAEGMSEGTVGEQEAKSRNGTK